MCACRSVTFREIFSTDKDSLRCDGLLASSVLRSSVIDQSKYSDSRDGRDEYHGTVTDSFILKFLCISAQTHAIPLQKRVLLLTTMSQKDWLGVWAKDITFSFFCSILQFFKRGCESRKDNMNKTNWGISERSTNETQDIITWIIDESCNPCQLSQSCNLSQLS